MELKLDNYPLEVVETDGIALREVINRVSEYLRERKRVISEILVDGHQMAGWDDPEFADRTVGQCGSLILLSEDPRHLAHKVLYDIAGYIPRIREALVETATLIQSRKEEEGMHLLEQITGTWSELYVGFRNALIVTGIDLSSVTLQGRTFTRVNEEIHELLGTVSNLVQDQRFLELSDVLEYELAPKMPLVEEGIYRLIKELEKKPN